MPDAHIARVFHQIFKFLIFLFIVHSGTAYAAITAYVTYQTHAEYVARGNPAPGQVMFLRSNTARNDGNYDEVANNGNARLNLSGNVTNSAVNLGSTAGYFTVVYNHANFAQASGCTTSPITFTTQQYIANGGTINVTVTCTVPDTTGPQFVSAATNSAGTTIDITYDEDIDYYSNGADFTLREGGVTRTLSYNTHNSTVLTLNVSPALSQGTTLTLDFTDTGAMLDFSGNSGVNFSNKPVTNNVVSSNPTVTDAKISISGASGSGGAFRVGDTVTVTWNNTGSGDNNSGITDVTVDFSQFGGGAAVVATNSSNTWTATYVIPTGALDAANRNVSVTATKASGSTTTADTSNATLDNQAPTVSDGRISISGASGSGGAFKIGDTVTASWNNTAGGDNNADTISSVAMNFSAFGGGASVTATNSSGTWTATYTIVAGAIDAINRNASVTATDNAGNSTTVADSSNATVDNIAPTVTGSVPDGGAQSTDASVDFTVNYSESVSNVSIDDFALGTTGGATGTINNVSANSGSSILIQVTGIAGNGTLKLNHLGSTNAIDDVGNTVAAFTSGTAHTVAIPTAPDAPTIGAATAGDGQVSVAFTAPGNNGGSAITGYTVTSNPGGITAGGNGFTTSPITVTGLTNGTAYTFTVTATNAIGTSTASGASNAATPKANQTITFANPGSQNFGTAPTLSATSDSGLTVSFTSSTTGVCTITAGGALTFVTAGNCTIDADQAGNASVNAAATVSRTFSVNAVMPGAPTIGTATAGDTQASVTFSAPASSGGASITGYTVTASPGGATGTGAGSPITVTGLTNGVAYTFSVTATNSAGTGSASAASNSITPASPQTITFNNPGAQNFGTSPTLTATSSAGGGYPVTFASSTTGVCTITSGGLLTFVTAGTCTINADQAGDSSFLAAPQVSQSFTVTAVVAGAPTAATATAGDTQVSIAFTAPVNTGGATITGYTVTANPGGLTGTGATSPIIVTGLTNGQAYTFTVTATNSAGTGAASVASNSVTPKAAQTITLNNPGAQNFGTTPTLTATASSSLVVTFTSSTTSVCTITSGGALTFVSAGTCTINADQAGDSSYLAAPQVSRSFTVNAVVSGAPAIGTATVQSATSVSVSFTAPVSNGGSSITGYTVTSNPGGLTATGSSSPITVTGLTAGQTYTFTVTATNGAGTSTSSAATSAVSLPAPQTITFANPGTQVFGSSPTLTATASSGLAVEFTSATTAVCTVSGGTLTFVSAGTCTINANQPGDASFQPATQVSQTFAVNAAVPGAPAIGSATVVDGSSVSVSFNAPAFSGGSAVTSYTVTSVPGGLTVSGIGSPLTVTGLTAGTSYSFVVTATNSAGTGAASAASNSVTPQGNQTITFANPGAQLYGSNPVLSASASSGLPVSFSSTTTSVCTVTSGGLLSFVAPGSCTIVAAQSGNSSFLAADAVSQTFAVNAAVPGAPAIGSATVVDGSSVSVSFSAPAFSGGSAVTSYTVTSVPGGLTVSGIGSPLTVTGLTAGTSYSFVVTATNSAGTGAASAASNSVIPKDPNTAPVIGGNPATSVKAGMPYSFTPSANDADAADTLTFSISNKPAWATFSTSTGSLTGTPAQSDAGTTSGIVISVSDGKVSASLPAFDLQVIANTAPVATPGSSVLNEDEPASIELAGTDAESDNLTVEIVTQPQHGKLSQNGNAWLYTPDKDYHGTDSLGFIVKDSFQSSAAATYSLTITPVNDVPLAVDDNVTLTRTANDQYSLSVLGNDSDADGDTLQLAGATATLGTVTVSGNSLNFTAPAQYTGAVQLKYSVSDGNKGLSTAGVTLAITGAPGAVLPVITVPADVTVDATALYTRVNLGTATAVDRNGRQLRVSLLNGSLFFAPGDHLVYWQATDADGNTATKSQRVRVHPLVSLSKDQVVTEGSDVTVEVVLNGPAPSYPVRVPYTVSGSADGSDHTLSSGIVEISSGVSVNLTFTVLEDGRADDGENLVIGLGDTVNRGVQRSTSVSISEANVPPEVTLSAFQQDEARLTVSRTGGEVLLSASATDANANDQLSLAWQTTLPLTIVDATSRSFNPAAVSPGVYPVSVKVSDNGSPAKDTTAQLYLVVQASLPELGGTDTDGDLIPDDQEGFADTDRDGIPDYKDAINECNVVPEADREQVSFLAEGEPGACLRRGQQSILASSGGLELANTEVETDTSAQNSGGIFDFIAYNLPQAGQSYQLVLPQRLPVPATAVYRKYNSTDGWVAFVTDSKNHIRSAQGERGFCPPPGDAAYTAGLTANHWCVQVTVEDGGPNDADGLINAAIVDPGGVAVPVSSNKLPQAKPDSATTRMNLAVTTQVLANDTDADNDTLTISQAVANFGVVKIETDNKLTYTPAKDYVGTDVVIYSINDGKGGTASSELTVTVRLNNAPVAGADTAATDDRTAISISVLTNDSDADSDALNVISASAAAGTVTIESNNRLRYTPKAGFNGADAITYRISDGFGGEASGQVSVTVTAYQTVTVSNKSSGGTVSAWWLGLLTLLWAGRRYATLALLLCGSAQAGDWQLQLGAGQSKVSQSENQLQTALPAGTVRSIDDSDRTFSASVQYQWLERLDLELGYVDMGTASADIAADTLTPAQYHQAVQSLTPVLGDGVFAGVRIGVWQQYGWRLQLPFGMVSWQSDIDSSMNGSTLHSETDGTDLYYGLALQYLHDAHWAAGISWQQMALEPEDVRVLQFTLSYRF